MIGGKTDDDILKWGNSRVNSENQIQSFRDKSISNCKFLFNLLASIEARAIDETVIL